MKKQDKWLTHTCMGTLRLLGKIYDIGELPGRVAGGTQSWLQSEPSCRSRELVWTGQKD